MSSNHNPIETLLIENIFNKHYTDAHSLHWCKIISKKNAKKKVTQCLSVADFYFRYENWKTKHEFTFFVAFPSHHVKNEII